MKIAGRIFVSAISSLTVALAAPTSTVGEKYSQEKLRMGLDNLFPYPIGIILQSGDVIPMIIDGKQQNAQILEDLFERLEAMYGSVVFEPMERSDAVLGSSNSFDPIETATTDDDNAVYDDDSGVIGLSYIGKSSEYADSYDFEIETSDNTSVMITVAATDYEMLQIGSVPISQLSPTTQAEMEQFDVDFDQYSVEIIDEMSVLDETDDEFVNEDGEMMNDSAREERKLFKYPSFSKKSTGSNFIANYTFPPNASKKYSKTKMLKPMKKLVKPKLATKKFPLKSRVFRKKHGPVYTKNGTKTA